MKNTKSLVLFFASLSFLAGCASKPETASSSGYVDNYPTLKGFDIDLAKATFKKLGITPVFQEIVWEQKETELSAKQIDLIWNGLTITDERKESMEISIPYMTNSQVIVAKNDFADDAITSDDNYKVAFEQGSAGEDTFNNYTMFSGCTSAALSAQTNALTEVLSGTSDLAIIDSVMAGYYLSGSSSYASKLKILSEYSFDSEYYGIAGRKGETGLMGKINETLTSLYNDGTIASIASSYGLTNDLVKPEETSPSSTETSSWDYITSRGTVIIGYTIFAPIAFSD